jgi:flagellar biosynthesis protein FlgN
MTAREALHRLFDGMRADAADYNRLRELLEEQFNAALAHRTEEIGVIVEKILALTATLSVRSRERAELARALSKSKVKRVSMRAFSAHLQPPAREKFESAWKLLETLVRECKRLNVRNGHLLMTQRDIMVRVLNVEPDVYAPA